MQWTRRGLIFCPDGGRAWMRTHAAVPTADHLYDDVFRIYFSARDESNRSHIGSLDLDIRRPKPFNISTEPLLSPGEIGTFDDSGAMPSWVVTQESQKLMYYIGWNRGTTVPFRNSIGLALQAEDGRLNRLYTGPVMDRSMVEPHFCANPCVIVDGAVWRMWYISCTGWFETPTGPMHRYHLKYAESDDGVIWRRDGVVAIDYENASEYAISRPSVIKDAAGWHMWYSRRGIVYEIGYATSRDGIEWTRRDHEAGIAAAPQGWDSEMIEYPFVFDHDGDRYMLYNGNGYGKTGFGLAILEK